MASFVSAPVIPVLQPLRFTSRMLVVLIGFSLAGALLVFIATPHGEIIVTPDSANYVAAARSLVEGQGYLRFEGRLFKEWPPLYPTLLAGVDWLAARAGSNILEGIRVLNALTFAAVIFTSGLLFLRYLSSKAFTLVGLAAILVAYNFLVMSVQAWSEPLTVLLFNVFLLQLDVVLRRGTPGAVLLLALLAALAGLQRYPSIALTFVGAVCILLLLPEHSLRTRLVYAMLFGVIAAAPVTLWLVRNYFDSGALVRRLAMSGAPRPLTDGIGRVFNNVLEWFVPPSYASFEAGRVLGILFLIPLLTASTLRFERVAAGAARRFRLAKSAPVALLIVIYCIFLILTTTRPGFGPISDRFLTPIFPGGICLVLTLAERLSRRLYRRTRQRITSTVPVLAAVTLFLVSYNLSLSAAELERLRDWCCRPHRLEEVTLFDWLAAHPLDGAIYSNTPLALFYGRQYAVLAPETLHDWQIAPADYLIWLDEAWIGGACNPTTYCFDTDYELDDLRGAIALQPLVELPEGGVYRVVRQADS